MKKIRPISDLRNNFAEVSREVHEHNEPEMPLIMLQNTRICILCIIL